MYMLNFEVTLKKALKTLLWFGGGMMLPTFALLDTVANQQLCVGAMYLQRNGQEVRVKMVNSIQIQQASENKDENSQQPAHPIGEKIIKISEIELDYTRKLLNTLFHKESEYIAGFFIHQNQKYFLNAVRKSETDHDILLSILKANPIEVAHSTSQSPNSKI
jgi:hypothetical protein